MSHSWSLPAGLCRRLFLTNKPSEATLSFERASDLALVLAYVISVCLYIHILSAFVLTGFGVDSDVNEDFLTTTVIATITIVGVVKGLDALEFLEKWSLYITFLIIALLILGFAYHDWGTWRSAAGITATSTLPLAPTLQPRLQPLQ